MLLTTLITVNLQLDCSGIVYHIVGVASLKENRDGLNLPLTGDRYQGRWRSLCLVLIRCLDPNTCGGNLRVIWVAKPSAKPRSANR
ncbi:hypothetical protein C7B77_09645 [Chamaesiphon polymorphus CCALA 037]|uniref:Uncharacterized protein n=1 Tax=Chamaesiphon polymorphus CCALA 037 TaxID=2107692 RepID=A0A2T1GHC0_9CYAN|nr:hypothetical protein C7B77_09645 [Chamaesiphon polymorphus CCALA 037]